MSYTNDGTFMNRQKRRLEAQARKRSERRFIRHGLRLAKERPDVTAQEIIDRFNE